MKNAFVKSLVALSLVAAGAANAATSADNGPAKYSANDMNVSLTQLYPAAYKADASSGKTRQEVFAEYQAARDAGELSAVGDTGLTQRQLFPQQYAGKAASRTRMN